MATAQQSETAAQPAAISEHESQDALDRATKHNWWLVGLGPVAGLLLGLVLPDSLSFEGRAVAGCALWMAIWWMTEAAPIPVTSLRHWCYSRCLAWEPWKRSPHHMPVP